MARTFPQIKRFLLLLAWFPGIMVIFAGQAPSSNSTARQSEKPSMTPAITLAGVEFTNLDNSVLRGSDLSGQIVLLDFWAVWCGPCLKAFPDLIKLNRDLADQNFAVVSIASYSGTAQDVRKVVDQYAIDYRVIMGDPELVEQFGVIGFPTYFLMGPDGNMVKKYVGEVVGLYDRVISDVRAIQSELSVTVGAATSPEGGH